ncbi:MAG: D-glucuronyl C5-epimerase family protein, partial [Deltaproteobacteria bacterium]|nr:D-glucuronyl C5-epimerase family protein [Deltaproteobacteria bacterium]
MNRLPILLIFLLYSFPTDAEEMFALPLFYRDENPYNYLITPKEKKQNVDECDAYMKPIFGVMTDKKYVYSPTKAAVNGLIAILGGNKEISVRCSELLQSRSKKTGDAMFFPFEFDYVPYMPINLRKGWVSAISQGLSLGLFTHLYSKTGEVKYLKTTKKVFQSYRLPVEKGGFVRNYADSAFFEEYPAKEFTGVFNGGAVAALALWDYYVITKDKEAKELFFKYVKWLEENISRYEKLDKDTGVLLSYYSLVVKRPDVLFRFFGEGQALIKNISFACIKDESVTKKFSLRLGIKRDDDPEEYIYIWSDIDYTNWSERLESGRIINKNSGMYNHSPFYTYLDSECEEAELEISFK